MSRGGEERLNHLRAVHDGEDDDGDIHRLNISSVNMGDRLMSLEDRLCRRFETIISERLEPLETLWRESVLNRNARPRVADFGAGRA